MKRILILLIALGVACITAEMAHADLNDGLVAYYKFEGNADDSSGNNYHGTELGGVNYLPGKVGQDADFDGVDAYIDMGVQLGGYSALSVFAWVKGKSLHAGNNFIQSASWWVSDAIGSDGGFQLAITNGFIRSWLTEDKLTYSLIVGPSIQLDRWYLIGYTWDGSTHRLYLDGVEVGSNPYTGTIGTSSKNALVASKYRGAGFEGFFGGEIDELRIYNRALSTSEIQVLYTPPTVSSTSPSDGATDVAVDAAVTATFSEDIDAATINTNTFTVDNGVTGTVIYDANSTTTTFTPTMNLDYDTTYTATITTGVEDLAGNPLQADYVWSFTTGSAPDTNPPTVSSTSPTDNATDVAVDAAVTATFSEAMDAATISTGTFLVNDGLVDIAGTVSCNVNIVTFTPTTDLDDDTTYTATITTDSEDLAGNAMQADYVWVFTTQSNTNDDGSGGGGGGG